ncbi:hypothetical protein [Acrocarpospora catenulata]|uniref:hypothetical protein n=1 Tax=Acrocarpospora catenulata TaxID=2836182 RepID=UPI001BDAD343|nr:hypothetical protein [Acrocarpospora catenulata]
MLREASALVSMTRRPPLVLLLSPTIRNLPIRNLPIRNPTIRNLLILSPTILSPTIRNLPILSPSIFSPTIPNLPIRNLSIYNSWIFSAAILSAPEPLLSFAPSKSVCGLSCSPAP